jgi:hypothetical protein
MVTTKIIANKILAYLKHQLSLNELVDWAENTLMSMDYKEEDDSRIARNVLAQLGLADVKAFGLDWEHCEKLMHDLGYRLEVNASEMVE